MVRQIAVVGPGDGAAADECTIARQVGLLLANAGIHVVCGGLGGVMAAVAQGCKKGGGISVGILPTLDVNTANQFLSVVIPTSLGEMRNALVVGAADGVIVIGGSWGTLSELALAKRRQIPVVSIGGWRILNARGAEAPIVKANSAAEAVSLVLQTEARRAVASP